jgi:hypothetical protein
VTRAQPGAYLDIVDRRSRLGRGGKGWSAFMNISS